MAKLMKEGFKAKHNINAKFEDGPFVPEFTEKMLSKKGWEKAALAKIYEVFPGAKVIAGEIETTFKADKSPSIAFSVKYDPDKE